jgi:hypothetical protein
MAKDYTQMLDIYHSIPQSYEGKAQDSFAKFVEDRYYSMSYAKQPIRQVWQGTQDLYYANDWEWIVSGEDWNRPVRFPTLRDFIKSLTDVFMQDPPDILLKEKFEDDKHLVMGKKAYIDYLRDSIHEKSIRRQVIEDMFFFGKGFREVSYWNVEKEFNGEKECVFDDIATRRIDPRNVFVDENTNKLHDKLRIDGARDIILRENLPYSTYLALAEKKGWDTKVQPENYFALKGMDYLVSNSRELAEKTPVLAVKLYEYQNQEEDIFGLVANGKTVYESSLKKEKGTSRFNLVDYTYEFRNDSFWPNTLAQLIAPHIFLKDTLVNLEIMNLKLTLQPVVAVSSDFGFNRKIHVIQPGGVWQAQAFDQGKIQDKVMPLVTGNPNTKVYDMLQNINSELTITTRSDLRSLEYYKKKTATETIAQGQSQNAHNETIENINEIESEAVLWELAIEIMHEFMDEKNKKGLRRKVPIDDYAVTKNDSNAEFVRHVGYNDVFELTQPMIDSEAEMIVKDRRSEVAKNAEKMGRIMQAIPLIGNIAQLNPELMAKVNFEGILEQLVESVGLDVERSFMDDASIYEDEFENLAEEILLGHNVELPEGESRKDSMKRMKFLLSLNKKEQFKGLSKKAFDYHFGKTVENITRDFSKDVAKERGKALQLSAMEQMAQQGGQPMGGMSQTNLNNSTKVVGPNTGKNNVKNIPSPDTTMLGAVKPESLI